jgi:hypothetical protein
MADSPKDNQSKIETVRNAWKTLAPDKSFGGMTYAQFEAATAPSFTTRQQLEENDNQRTQLLTARAGADDVSLSKVSLVVNGVRADPNFGDDSGLIEAMGYTRTSERKSGLTRKGGPSKPPTP